MRSSWVRIWNGLLPLGNVSASTVLAVAGERRFTVSLLTSASRQS